MGKIKRGILGGFSGKVANVVGTSWKGIAVMKSLPLSVANPRTVAQVANRTRNSAVLALGQTIGLSNVRTLWNRWAVGMSGFNSFMSANKDMFTSLLELVPAKFFLSLGAYLKMNVDYLQITATYSTNRVVVNYDDATSSGKYSADDVVYATVLDADGNQVCAAVVSDLMSNSAITLQCTNMELNQLVFVYVTVLKADGTQVSDSVYVGTSFV